MRQDKRLHTARIELPLVHERGVKRDFNGPHPCVGLELINRRVLDIEHAPRNIPQDQLPTTMQDEKILDYRCSVILRMHREDSMTTQDAIDIVEVLPEENVAKLAERIPEEDVSQKAETIDLGDSFDRAFVAKFNRAPTDGDRKRSQMATARKRMAENRIAENRACIVDTVGWLRSGKLKAYFIEPRTNDDQRYQRRSIELQDIVQVQHQRVVDMSIASSRRYLIQTPDGCLSYVDEGAGLFIAFPMTLVTSLLFTKAMVTKRFAADFFENEDALWPRKAK